MVLFASKSKFWLYANYFINRAINYISIISIFHILQIYYHKQYLYLYFLGTIASNLGMHCPDMELKPSFIARCMCLYLELEIEKILYLLLCRRRISDLQHLCLWSFCIYITFVSEFENKFVKPFRPHNP
jgi:hypothetical protein